MEGFREGYDFFESHAGNFCGLSEGIQYVNAVDSEISDLMDSLNEFKSSGVKIDTLKGDVAEFWHAGTFNIKAAIHGSGHRAQVIRSHDFASVDISGRNFDGDFGLKYYKDGVSSAKQQAKSIFVRFKEYKYQGGKDELDTYLDKRGYSADAVLSDPVYSGQYRVIPSDQMKEATAWLERKIAEESVKRSLTSENPSGISRESVQEQKRMTSSYLKMKKTKAFLIFQEWPLRDFLLHRQSQLTC